MQLTLGIAVFTPAPYTQIHMDRKQLLWAGVVAVIGLGVAAGIRFMVPGGQRKPVPAPAASPLAHRQLMVTNGTKHNVPLDEIQNGGPARDGIPPIDHPKFVTIAQADTYVGDDEPGIAFTRGDVHRFYPYQILVWHEVVNDTIAGERVLVTYCPLCLSGIVLDPLVGNERVEFGTSGKLWNSNLVMYDRKTESLWSQVLGEAIVGEMTGTKLAVLLSDVVKYGQFKQLHPNGEVLSRDTGVERRYGDDPYGNYYSTPDVWFPVGNRDDRLGPKEFILGISANGSAKAYWPEAVKEAGTVEDQFFGKTIVARYEHDIGAIRLYEKTADGNLERINPIASYWFAWAAAHPNTELYRQP